MIEKYAHLLAHYSLSLRAGEKLFIQTTTLAEPLVKAIFKEASKMGVQTHINMKFQGQDRIFLEHAPDELLMMSSTVQKLLFETYDAYLHIRAPFNSADKANVSNEKLKLRQEANKEINSLYSERTAVKSLKRSLCEFPTNSSAQNASMSLDAYSDFIFSACKLFDDDPIASWIKVHNEQQRIIDYLNKCNDIHYLGPNCDIRFSCRGRVWINSDGQTNMPSGEVYTAPVDDSTNGWIKFSYPSIFNGVEVKDVRLEVKDGWIENWEASQGKELLDQIFEIEGARRFGEAAIGTNYGINRITKNILFDEKIGGSIHMAVGQAYLQNNGKNKSAIHWDMITDMTDGGQIFADGSLIYENGKFVI